MNKVILMGRLTKDPTVRYTAGQNSMAVARYTLAVDRPKKGDGKQGADFISCVAFAGQGEFAEKYLHKGIKIAVEGKIQTGSYTDQQTGKTVFTTEVVVNNHEFCESKVSGNAAAPTDAPAKPAGQPAKAPAAKTSVEDDFKPIPDDFGFGFEMPA